MPCRGLELTGDSTLLFDLHASLDNTRVTVANQLGAGSYLVDIVNPGSLTAGEYLLLQATSWEAADFSLLNPISGYGLNWNDGNLTLTVVPESNTAFLMLLGGTGMAWLALRKRARERGACAVSGRV